mgnify:CR=1 FL=1
MSTTTAPGSPCCEVNATRLRWKKLFLRKCERIQQQCNHIKPSHKISTYNVIIKIENLLFQGQAPFFLNPTYLMQLDQVLCRLREQHPLCQQTLPLLKLLQSPLEDLILQQQRLQQPISAISAQSCNGGFTKTKTMMIISTHNPCQRFDQILTLWTNRVPARPLRPAIPLGGRAQSSPTITIYQHWSPIKLEIGVLILCNTSEHKSNDHSTSTLKPSAFACSAARPKFRRSPV